jgi:branched-subunit amino acid transport protein
MSAWCVVLAAGVVSYLMRALPVALLSGRPAPAWLELVGALAGPVAFTALAAAAVASAGHTDPSGLLPRLAALTVAGAVAYRAGSVGLSVLGGMATLWVLVALLT